MRKQQVKQLKKAYKRSFNTLHKSFFQSNSAGFIIFIEYLKYLRDLMILSADSDLEKVSQTNTKLTKIITAIAEYEASVNSADQKNFHWNNFCELVKQNMEEWLELDDSV
jgi:hypothetical protein